MTSNIQYFHKSKLYSAALQCMQPVDSLLDIGCGIVPQRHVITKTHICCEPYDEYVNVLLSQSKMSRRIVLNMGWEDALKYFPEKSIDSIILVDVIEHLEKEEGRLLLEKTIKLAKK